MLYLLFINYLSHDVMPSLMSKLDKAHSRVGLYEIRFCPVKILFPTIK